ncbi:hypothetical protein LUZ61_008737 [Rhynchospora tenuis]|uniref:EF-hand domain-containing protein n=1 Tax=Rhynchospora tenuis TaxID=198213 RepID=A0AAD5ZVY1_9POAL|nr:hypothetical protein LUZ61_008737 [Rhynchospora tenuis]
MPINNGNPGHSSVLHSKKMTPEEFDKWLDHIDSNGDGNISRKELHGALKELGLKWKTWKSWWAIKKVDLNHNKVIDGKTERKLLYDYAAKYWGITVSEN